MLEKRVSKEDRVGGEKIKAKGIRAHVVKNHMTLEDHRKCLFGEEGVELLGRTCQYGYSTTS